MNRPLFAASRTLLSVAAVCTFAAAANARDDDSDEQVIEEIVVTGSQIRGANITDALAVSVFTSEDIELFGVDSGDDLLDAVPDVGTRVRLGVNNVMDERAPIYDRPFGYSDDAHRDWGVYYYMDLRLSF